METNRHGALHSLFHACYALCLSQRRGGGGPAVLKLTLPSPSRKGSDPTPLAGSPELTQDTFQTWEGRRGKEGGLEARAEGQQLGFDRVPHGVEVPSVQGECHFTSTLLPAHLGLTPPKELAQHCLPPGSLPGLTPPPTAWHRFASSVREGGETKTQHCIHSQLGAYTSQRAWSAFHLLHKCLKMAL